MSELRAVIRINQYGITGHSLNDPQAMPLIYFPHHGASPGYPEVASLDEAVALLEGQGYAVTVEDHLFNTGTYGIERYHGAGGVAVGWNLRRVTDTEGASCR